VHRQETIDATVPHLTRGWGNEPRRLILRIGLSLNHICTRAEVGYDEEVDRSTHALIVRHVDNVNDLYCPVDQLTHKRLL